MINSHENLHQHLHRSAEKLSEHFFASWHAPVRRADGEREEV